MLGIKDALNRIYSGENALEKHFMLFVLTGIPAMLKTPLNEISKRPDIDTATVCFALLTLLVTIIVSIYIVGYVFESMHNSFDKNKKEILADFNSNGFKLFFKGFPLLLTWFCYFFILFLALIGTLLFTRAIFGALIGKCLTYILFGVVYFILFLMLPFVFVKFTKEYSRKELYSLLLPFKDMKKTFSSTLLFIVKLIPLGLIVMIMNLYGTGSSVLAYIASALGGYMGIICQFVLLFGYVQIYKEKIENI